MNVVLVFTIIFLVVIFILLKTKTSSLKTHNKERVKNPQSENKKIAYTDEEEDDEFDWESFDEKYCTECMGCGTNTYSYTALYCYDCAEVIEDTGRECYLAPFNAKTIARLNLKEGAKGYFCFESHGVRRHIWCDENGKWYVGEIELK